MTRGVRMGVFWVGLAGLAAVLFWGIVGLPDFGTFDAPYGRLVDHLSLSLRNEQEVVIGTTFDFRGIDTIGEEFILFVAAVATTVLLRSQRDEQEEEEEEGEDEEEESGGAPASDALRALGGGLVGPVVVLGVYIVTHGHLTPGGGFQGGVILMAALTLVFVCGRFLAFTRVSPTPLVEFGEALGAGGFAAIGVGGLIAGGAFLYNFIPYGTTGSILSAGTIPLDNIAVGLEVAGAFALILSELLEQRLLIHGGGDQE